MQTAAIAVTAIVLLIDVLTHRFQRATLAVANLQTSGNGDRQEVGRLQMAMTPDWIGYLSLLEKLLAIAAAVLLFLAYSWWGILCFGALYLLGFFAGFVGLVLPVLPHAWNLSAIESYLKRNTLLVAQHRSLPAGATDDLTESMLLSSLVTELKEDYVAGKISVERIAAGYLDG